jgi:two-component system nitrate/nitrite response regulator NarL
MSDAIRVLIADDHASIRQALTVLLQTEGGFEVAGVASDGQEAVELSKLLRPDVVLMDVKMPSLDGIQAGTRILEVLPATKILMVSSDDTRERIEESMKMGAVGYLAKHCSLSEVPAAIRQIVAGSNYLCLASSRTLRSRSTGERIRARSGRA